LLENPQDISKISYIPNNRFVQVYLGFPVNIITLGAFRKTLFVLFSAM